jgi:hypothetical protein
MFAPSSLSWYVRFPALALAFFPVRFGFLFFAVWPGFIGGCVWVAG